MSDVSEQTDRITLLDVAEANTGPCPAESFDAPPRGVVTL